MGVWTVVFETRFEAEFLKFSTVVQDELLAHAGLLEQFGPALGRPHADTLAGSRFVNMKELRFSAEGGVWRVAFAFDPKRQAVLLVAANKRGRADKRFYKSLIKTADTRFESWLLEQET